jgi:hypothetical protein
MNRVGGGEAEAASAATGNFLLEESLAQEAHEQAADEATPAPVRRGAMQRMEVSESV